VSDKTNRYAALLKTSIDPSTSEQEQETARRVMAKMRDTDPGIHDRAYKIVFTPQERAKPNPTPGFSWPPPPGGRESSPGGLGNLLGSLFRSALGPTAKAFVDPYRRAVMANLAGEWQLVQEVYESAVQTLNMAGEAGGVDAALFIAAAHKLIRDGVVEARPGQGGLLIRRAQADFTQGGEG